MKKITNNHNVTFFEAEANTLTGKVVFTKIKGEKNIWGYATGEGQKYVSASDAHEALRKIKKEVE